MKELVVILVLVGIFIALIVGWDKTDGQVRDACSWACEKIDGSKPSRAYWNEEKKKCDCEWSYSHPKAQ